MKCENGHQQWIERDGTGILHDQYMALHLNLPRGTEENHEQPEAAHSLISNWDSPNYQPEVLFLRYICQMLSYKFQVQAFKIPSGQINHCHSSVGKYKIVPVIMHHTIKMEVLLHMLLTLALKVNEWSASHSGCFTLKKNPSTYQSRKLGGPQSLSRCCRIAKVPFNARNLTLVIQPLAIFWDNIS